MRRPSSVELMLLTVILLWALNLSVTKYILEHGLAPDPGVVRWQRRGNRINQAIAGCLLDTDVRGLLGGSPLTVTELDTWYEKAAPKPAAYMYAGRATA